MIPTRITVNRQAGALEITWADGHYSVYPLSGVRSICPCVQCRGGHENMGGPPDRAALHEIPDATWEVVGAEKVGNYALRLIWADGHDSGIYAWDYLRAFCPCPECEAASSSPKG